NSAAVTLSELPEGGAELNGGAIVGARIVDPSQSLTVHGDNNDTISVAGTAPLTLSSASLSLNAQSITFYTSASAQSINLNASSAATSAVRYASAGSLTATDGNIEVDSAGGISLGLATLSAANIELNAVGDTKVGPVSTSGSFISTSEASFDMATGASINAGGSVTIDHHSVIFRGPVTGDSISVSSTAGLN